MAWHVEKEVNERMTSCGAEIVYNHTSHAWSRFEGPDELGFIETEWLEKYRRTQEAIVHKRLEDFQS